MVRKAFGVVAAGFIVAFGFGAAPAQAARVLCTSGPVINLVTTPCIASGNDSEASVEAALFEAIGSTINLTLLGKSDDNPALFTFSAGPNEVSQTSFTIKSGTLVQYVTVKAAGEFKLYQLAGAGASSGTVSTLDMLNNGGRRPNISHISFFTALPQVAAVPEPGTWAMLILGFGAVGGALRRSRKPRPALHFA